MQSNFAVKNLCFQLHVFFIAVHVFCIALFFYCSADEKNAPPQERGLGRAGTAARSARKRALPIVKTFTVAVAMPVLGRAVLGCTGLGLAGPRGWDPRPFIFAANEINCAEIG